MEEENAGKQILKGLAETRRFFNQVSLLVQTAEESLKERGWEPVSSSYQSFEITSHLLRPQKWMPRWVSRFFVNEEHAGILVYIGVLLDGAGTWAGLREPWVTCGLFQYSEGNDPSENWALDWITTHLVFERDPDGEFHRREYPPEERSSEGILREATMALPLIEVTSADDLKAKVTDALLNEIRTVSEATGG